MISHASSVPHLPSTVSNSRLARRSRGYALLLVLAVLALAGTLLALIVL